MFEFKMPAMKWGSIDIKLEGDKTFKVDFSMEAASPFKVLFAVEPASVLMLVAGGATMVVAGGTVLYVVLRTIFGGSGGRILHRRYEFQRDLGLKNL